uniref:L-ascorbate oxidase n=1 Tax=Ananas comosus var. bracteatus TaxID=296719 RepID=A0A6V7QRI4_ANACO
MSRAAAVVLSVVAVLALVSAEDPYLYFTWEVTYGTIAPLGVPSGPSSSTGSSPGPRSTAPATTTSSSTSTTISTSPSSSHGMGSSIGRTRGRTGCRGRTARFCRAELHAAGGFGSLRVHSRLLIPVPFDPPADEFTALIGDWYTKDHAVLARLLEAGRSIGRPAGILINGKSGKDAAGKDDPPLFTVEAGKIYRFRVCNVGLKTSLNFRVQGHTLKLVEMDGSHTVQNTYDSLDVHVGQCYSVLVTADQAVGDYYVVASTRFVKQVQTATAVLRYVGSTAPPSAVLPEAPSGWAWSLNQWRSFRWNLTASAARPNPQGSYHYGSINITRTIKLANSRTRVDGKLRFALNGVSHVNTDTPVKLAEYFNVSDGVFKYNLIGDVPPAADAAVTIAPNIITAEFRTFIEIVFENPEKSIQSYHLDGYSFFPVGMGPGKWTPESRKAYNLLDAVSRHTIQVYPRSWTAIMLTFDNAGMWNLRSEIWERHYLGQQLYVSVLSPARSLRDEYNMPDNAIRCGAVVSLPLPPSYV